MQRPSLVRLNDALPLFPCKHVTLAPHRCGHGNDDVTTLGTFGSGTTRLGLRGQDSSTLRGRGIGEDGNRIVV